MTPQFRASSANKFPPHLAESYPLAGMATIVQNWTTVFIDTSVDK
ncbi:hypothetical protein [Leuconostoc citreum]|nr:hypothetical protein [Leuconostoc citreum]